MGKPNSHKAKAKRITYIMLSIISLAGLCLWLLACLFACGQLYDTYDLWEYISDAPVAVAIIIGLLASQDKIFEAALFMPYLKYDIMKHPTIDMTADGKAAPYIHGQAKDAGATIELVYDPELIEAAAYNAQAIELPGSNYVLLSEEDIEKELTDLPVA